MDLQAIISLVLSIKAQVSAYLPAILQIVGGFAVLATLTANKADDKIINTILKVINALALNLGLAKNKDE